MQANTPSHSARHMALIRAAHQVLDDPLVLPDPIALTLVGADGLKRIQSGGFAFHSQGQRSLRAFAVARSRIVEDELAQAVSRGVRQMVILGAGMDTFAYRNAHAQQGLIVYELDHPDTQAMKRRKLAKYGIAEPAGLKYVAINFEQDDLSGRLQAAGFHADEPAMFSWLGVSMYLPLKAVQALLSFVGTAASGSCLIFDYIAPLSNAPLAMRLRLKVLAGLLALKGEPWKTFFDPDSLSNQLKSLGFGHTENRDQDAINAQFFNGRNDRLSVRGPGHVMLARI